MSRTARGLPALPAHSRNARHASLVVSWCPVPKAIFGSIFIHLWPGDIGGRSQAGDTHMPGATCTGFIDCFQRAFQSSSGTTVIDRGCEGFRSIR